MNRVSLTLGLAAMDTCWVYPWSFLLGIWAAQPVGKPLLYATTVFALVTVGAFSTQVLGRKARSRRAARFGLASLAVVAAASAVRVDQYPDRGAIDWVGPLIAAVALAFGQVSIPVLAFALGLYLWWRGVTLGSQTPGYTEVESAFRWGIGRLIAFGLIVGLTTRPSALADIQSETTPFVVGFFFVGLVTLALGRLESLRTRTRKLAINSQWFGVLVLVSSTLILIALALGQVLSFDLLLVATRPLFNLLGWVLLLLIYAIVIPLSYVVQWVIYLVLSLLQPDPNRQPPQPPRPSELDNWLQRLFSEQIPPELLVALKAIGAALLLGIALLIVARALTRWRPSAADADATNEERESLWNGQRLRSLLSLLLERLFRRYRPAARLAETASASEPVTEKTDISSVRALYAMLLRRGDAAGVTRSAATTPLEHAPALVRVLQPSRAVVELTGAYVRARYAETEPDAGEVAELRDAAESIQPYGAVD